MSVAETETQTPRVPDGTELWETAIDGVVWVRVVDRRGNERQVKVGPSKGARLRIKTGDRENSQDSILKEGSDPFTNGTLRRIDSGAPEDPEGDLRRHTYTDAVLAFVMTHTAKDFDVLIDAMNERGVRSMKAYAVEHDGTVTQLAKIQDTIDEKYKIEAVMPSTAEIIEAEQDGRDA